MTSLCSPHEHQKHKLTHWKAGLIVLLASLAMFHLMTGRSRLGDPWSHVLTSSHFGVPQQLAQRGVEPFYRAKIEVGWDGQFYYFMSNDLLARDRESIQHIDSPAYRYQRIGLPLIAKSLATVTGQDWVSPTNYFWASLLIVAMATVALGSHFRTQGHSPYWALIWGLAFGTQVTLQTGLPDAAADGLLILAFVCLAQNRLVLYGISASLAALTREAYILFPFMVAAVHAWEGWQRRHTERPNARVFLQLAASAVPGLLFVAWHAYLKVRFASEAGSPVVGILDAPFSSWLRHLKSGLVGEHLFVPAGAQSHREAFQLTLFAILLGSAAWLSWKALKNAPTHIKALSLTSLSLVALYTCFGDTVMMHFSGYLKAANVFLWLSPVLWFQCGQKVNWRPTLFLAAYFLATIPTMWNIWIWNGDAAVSRFTRTGDVTDHEPMACSPKRPKLDVKLLRLELPSKRNALYLAMRPYLMVAHVRITNTGDFALRSVHAPGSFNIVSRWRNEKTQAVSDFGPRTMLSAALMPGESRDVAVVVRSPRGQHESGLLIGVVQEKCQAFEAVETFTKIDTIDVK